ncbi:N-acetylmuramoyl-L-alanine amidase [Oscillatoria sp. FACHB-1406]|uniref:N-acetylmuramoyl-L-alanine amidase n=1 Tax=Oscillatoria sp. FACHB-1406 TaxID=2692846 RepID=UPI0016879E5C|nr:N-acetylmuramoyl-L-alanine amidase [Oscillatoria sp. FACHB-1406]MBD2580571.1 N-acetylmuramoyl-L-alanine amidase [Oscillatoria sp. FACHB-1406]
MRIHLLVLTALSALFSTLPAQAAKLVDWQFNANHNQLNFVTDAGVRPTAKLIANPSRLIVDLPGTQLGKPTANQAVGGAVKSVRVGQVDADTTRLVVELEAGYAINPQEVQIVGANPAQWSVKLPTPYRAATVPSIASSPDFQITQNGLYVRLDGQQAGQIEVRRNDSNEIEVDLPDITLPASLTSRAIAVSRYGVSDIQFTQVSSSLARVTMRVMPESPNWTATFSRFGGLVLVPQGGMVVLRNSTPAPELAVPISTNGGSNSTAVVTIPVPPPLNPSAPIARPIPAPRPAPPTVSPPPSSTPSAPLPSVRNSRVVVMVDPGHGGQDSGAVGINGLREKDVILPISQEVAKILERQGVSTRLTRSDDTFVSLNGRTKMANQAGVDLFVSIHANSADTRNANGVETYYYSAGSGLAQEIQKSVIRRTGMTNRGVRQANFYVMKYSSMPAVLVEVGFVTGSSDSAKLSDPSFRRQMAEAIAEGILNYIARGN